MKRWVLLIILVVGLSSAATFALQVLPTLGSGSGGAEYLDLTRTGAPEVSTGPQPKLVFVSGGDTTYKFGVLPQRAEGSHVWKVKNEGEGDLVLKQESSTCSCTIAKFKDGEKAVLKPGEDAEINLQFETRENNGAYSKGATIATNDPATPTFSLQAVGQVFPAVMTMPQDYVNFSTISSASPSWAHSEVIRPPVEWATSTAAESPRRRPLRTSIRRTSLRGGFYNRPASG